MDITNFPFDQQMCRIKLGSWTYTSNYINVWNSSSNGDSSNYVDGNQWKLIDYKVRRHDMNYTVNGPNYSDVSFYIIIISLYTSAFILLLFSSSYSYPSIVYFNMTISCILSVIISSFIFSTQNHNILNIIYSSILHCLLSNYRPHGVT